MSFWSHNLRQTAQLKKFDGLSNSGQPSYQSAIDIDCRVEKKIDNREIPEGSSEDLTTVIYTDVEINAEDRIILPDGEDKKLTKVQASPRLTSPNEILYKGEF